MQETETTVTVETPVIAAATTPATPAPVELTLEQLQQVSGAGPKGTW
jgi:hypothetical protein